MRGVRTALALAAIALAACATPPRTESHIGQPPASARVGLRDTPAGRALAEWLAVYNLGDADSAEAFAARRYTAAELRDRPAADIARGQRLWRMNYGRMTIARVDSSAPHTIEALVREEGVDAFGKVFVEVDTARPHGIGGVWLIPFVRPPAELAPAAPATDLAMAAALERTIAGLAERDVFSGVVLVSRRGRPLVLRAVGAARRDPHIPNTPETRFELASLSKLFTAVAIGQLVEQGKLSFESTVLDALPDYPNRETGRRITVHHLLTHTSGLPDFYRNGKIRQYEDSIRSLRDFWRTFVLDSLWSAPGARHDYSNSNYIVLGSIVEHLSGLGFEDYVRRHIFEPAGMSSTCYCEPGAPRYATPHSRYTTGFGPSRRSSPDRWIAVPPAAKRPGAPAGGGISTVGDLARFAEALLEHRLLGPAITERVLAPRVPMEDGGQRAYGFESYDWYGTRFVGHGGNFWGVMTQLDIYRESGHVVIVLANSDASGGEAIRWHTRMALSRR